METEIIPISTIKTWNLLISVASSQSTKTTILLHLVFHINVSLINTYDQNAPWTRDQSWSMRKVVHLIISDGRQHTSWSFAHRNGERPLQSEAVGPHRSRGSPGESWTPPNSQLLQRGHQMLRLKRPDKGRDCWWPALAGSNGLLSYYSQIRQ